MNIKSIKKISMFTLWNKFKNIPFIGKILVDFYYLLNQNRQKIVGDNNKVNIEFKEGSIPQLKNVDIKIYGNENYILIEKGVHIFNAKIEIHGDHNFIVIKNNCRIKGGFLWVEDYNCKIEIGEKSTFEADLRIHVSEPNSTITIGKNCMFAHGTIVRCADSHSIIDLDTNERINYAENINIGDRVWIAAHAQILKGVSIGHDSVIAAGSIVTKNVPNNSIAVGIPAQVKKNNIAWDRKKIMKKSEKNILVSDVSSDLIKQ